MFTNYFVKSGVQALVVVAHIIRTTRMGMTLGLVVGTALPVLIHGDYLLLCQEAR